MSVYGDITAAEQITALLEILRTASAKVTEALGRPYEAGAIALQWIDGEITPLLAAIEAKRQATWLVCPECARGEARYVAGLVTNNAPHGVTFSCGHRVRMRGPEDVTYTSLTLSSSAPVTVFAQVVARPQVTAMRPVRVAIAPNPERWIVDEILVGNRPQITGPLAGELFAREAAPVPIQWETCQTAMDFVIRVRYVGPSPEGEMFMAAVFGVAADDGRYRPPTRPQVPRQGARPLTHEQQRQLRGAWGQVLGVPPTNDGELGRTEVQALLADLDAMTPRDRAAYRARELEANRLRADDGAGGCTICGATLGLWCDHVAHRRSTIVAEVSAPNIRIDGTERTSQTTVTEVDEYE